MSKTIEFKTCRVKRRHEWLSRGQASAPIELVVAVIILVASMGLAFTVLQSTQSAQCIDKTKSQMRGLEAVMLDVALGSPSTLRETKLELSSCGADSIEAIRIVYYDSPSYCAKCSTSAAGCWKIEPLAYRASEKEYFVVPDAVICVNNMPGRVLLEADEDSCSSSGLISTPHTSGEAGCPVNVKDHKSINCGLPPTLSSLSNSKLLTMGKAPGETQYTVRIAKAFDTASGDPRLKICFMGKEQVT